MAITEKVTVKLIGKDQLSSVFSKTGKQMDGFREKLNKMGKMATIAAGAFVVGFGVKSVQAAVKFEKSMANVSTLVDTSTESMEAMGDKVKDISKRVPVDIEELTTALYDVRSAGISAADAMEVLETSGKLAVAGLGTTQEATNLLTSAINVYGDETHSADQLANILFKTVKAGKTTIAELSTGFGKVAAIAKETGISIEDLSAATAILTTGGIKAAEAQTSLKAMISNILKPTSDATAAAQELGIEFNLGALEAKGLSGMLKEIAEKAGDDKQSLADLFGSVEAANAIFALTSEEGGAALNKTLADMNSETNELQAGFDKVSATTGKQFQLFLNNLNVIMTELGTEVLPVLITAMKFVLKGIEAWKVAWDDLTDSLAWLMTKLEKVSEWNNKASNATSNFVGSVTGALTGSSRGESNIPFLPFFQEGGVVPGSPGQAVPIMAHGGETVIPSDKSAGSVFNFNFQGAFIGDKEAFKNEVISLIARQAELSNLGAL